MTTKLESLVRQATVPLTDAAGGLLGTAFFVLPGSAITAAHVVDGVVDGMVFAPDRRGVLRALSVGNKYPPEVAPGVKPYPLPDLALLHARGGFEDMPCVLLGQPGTAAQLLAIGHSRSIDPRSEFGQDIALLDFEGIIQEQGTNVLKVRQGEVLRGMSGSPVLDREQGAIVGVVKASRGLGKPYGAYIVAADELQHLEHSVWAQNDLHHRTNPAWRSAKAGDFGGPDPVAATLDIVDAVIRDARSRRETLPEGVDTEALHQTVWLRRRPIGDAKPGSTQPGGVSPRQRWRSERTMPGLTVVSGDPGFGKSWLLARQASHAASQARGHLDAEGSVDDCVIPVRLTCATLASDNGYGADVHGLARTLVATTLSHREADENAGQGHVAVMERALIDGRVLVCLDGLDEMPTGLQSRLKQSLGLLLSFNNTLLLASRPAALPIIDELAVGNREDFELVGFSTRETVNFVRAWLADRPEAADALLAAFTERSELAELAEVPLLLSFLCRLADPNQRQDYRRATLPQLYHDVARHLLSGRWRGGPSPAGGEATPDSVLRMQLLAEVLGSLQDSWRGGVEDIPRADLWSAIRRHPAYEAVAATAMVRMKRHVEAMPNPDAGVAEPVLWELLYDGILVEAADSPVRPTVRFIHPILRETVLAAYFAGLSLEQQLACIDRHRWLDGSWTRVFAAAASLVDHPAALVAHIVSEAGDPWVVQRTLAAQIIAESVDYRDEASAQAVRDAILVASRSPLVFERRRAVAALGILLQWPGRSLREWARTRVKELVELIAGERSLADSAHPDTDVEIAYACICSLLDAHDEAAVRHARTLVTSDRCPQALRLRLIAGLVALNTRDAADVVAGLLEQPSADGDELAVFLGALRSHSHPAVAAASRLLRNRRFLTRARVQIGRALLECGPNGVDAVRATADDRTMNWGLRCRLYADMVRAAVPDVVAPSMRLLASQHPRYDDRAELTLALIEDGVAEAIPHAAAAMVNPNVHWRVRESLGRALARQGEAGRDLLAAQLDHGGIELNVKLRHICALLEVRDRRGSTVALNLHSDRGVERWIRVKLADTLLRHEPKLANEEALIELATSEEIEQPERLEVITEMARQSLASTEVALMSLLRERHDGADSWPDASMRLAEAGWTGRRCLQAVANDPDLDWSVRCEALLGIEKTSGGAPRPEQTAETIAAMPRMWHNRLVLGLARNGLVPDLDEFVAVAREQRGGYRIVFEFLQRSAVDHAMMERLLEVARELQHSAGAEGAASHSGITLNEALLAELGLEYQSQAEAQHLLEWIYEALEIRVGTQLVRLMLAEQVDEFEVYADANDEAAAVNFLEHEIPEYREVVDDVFTALKEQIRDGSLVPPPMPDLIQGSLSLLTRISKVSAFLSEWVGAARTRQWDRWTELTVNNAELLGSDIAIGVLDASVRLDPSWGLHEAALFVANRLARGESGVLFEYPALINWLKGRLEDDDFSSVLYGGLYATVRFTEHELGWLYAAVGAEQVGRHQLALRLIRVMGQSRPPAERQDSSMIIDQFQPGLGWTDEVVGELRAAYVQGVEQPTLADYEQAVEREPGSAVHHFDLGIVLQRLGRHADAVESYRRAVDIEPADGVRRRALAGALSEAARHEEALAEVDAAIGLDRSDHFAHSLRGAVLGRLQRHEEALAAFGEAHRLAPTNPYHVANRASALRALGRFEEAAEVLHKAVELGPRLVSSRTRLAEVLILAKRYEEALTEAEIALQLDPANAQAHFAKGVALNSSGREAEAEQCFRAAVRLEPENLPHLSGLAGFLHHARRYAEAATVLRKCAELDPASAATQRGLAQMEAALRRRPEALAAAAAALALDPDNPMSHDIHGWVLNSFGRHTEAAQAFGEAVRLGPELSVSRANYGEALILCGRLDEAEGQLREAIRLGPANDVEANVLLAIAVGRREPDEAGELARRALNFEAEWNITPFRHRELRSIAWLLVGDVAGACAEMRDAVGIRREYDREQEPLYEQLRGVVGAEAVDAVLEVWPTAGS